MRLERMRDIKRVCLGMAFVRDRGSNVSTLIACNSNKRLPALISVLDVKESAIRS
jgi:hypothetical protein